MLLAGNGLLAFVGWEMCGISSFLLIGYAWHRQVATGNALFAFVTNRGGDAGFLLGLGLAAAWLGSFEWTALANAKQLSVVDDRLLVIGFVIAALAKSAQLPFSAWISRASRLNSVATPRSASRGTSRSRPPMASPRSRRRTSCRS